MTRPSFNDRLLLGLEGHDVRSRAALHPGPAARRAALQGPPRRAADAAAGRAGLRPRRQGRARPRRRRATRHRATCSPPSPAPARPAPSCKRSTTRVCCSRPGCASGRTRASWPGCRCEHWRVLRTLHNPRYAGAFVYGRRREPQDPDGKTFHETLPRDQWTALIPDAHPGYITWDSSSTTRRCSPPTPRPTAPNAPPVPPAKAPPCCKASPSAAAAGGA